MYSLFYPTGIVVYSLGNVYISSHYCHWIMKWAPNVINATLIAGSSTGALDIDSQSL
ncbi:unnamed protein product, partial [Rotaria sp. Silwood1]